MVIDLIELRGTNYEQGIQQGRLYQMLVGHLNMVEVFRNMAIIEAGKPIGGQPFNLIFDQITRYGGRKIMYSIKETFPHQYERLMGLAEGFGITSNQLCQVLYIENFAGDYRFRMQIPRGCTAGIIRQNIEEPQSFLLKNFDYPNELQDFQIIRKCDNSPSQGYRSIGVTEGPLPGIVSGMNEHGLALTLNAAYSRDLNLKSPPTTIALQEGLETCKTAEDAIEFFSKIPVPTGWMIGIIDHSGNGTFVERTPNSVGIRDMKKHSKNLQGSYLGQANTFIHVEPKKYELPEGTRWNIKDLQDHLLIEPSTRRYERMEFLLQNLLHKNKKISISALHAILADHSNNAHGGDNTICRHEQYYKTLSSVIFDTVHLKTYLSDGNACENEKMNSYDMDFRYNLPNMRFMSHESS